MIKRLLPAIPFIVLIACSPDISDPGVQAAVIHSLTATVWTPTPITPSPTPEPNTAKVVELLNDAMVGADPLMETIAAKYSVIDAQVIVDTTTHQAVSLQVYVDCQWIYTDGCTPENTFVILVRAFSVNNKIMGKIQEQIPPTIQTLEVLTFEQMTKTSLIHIAWKDICDYTEGRINGNQLGSRMVRFAVSP